MDVLFFVIGLICILYEQDERKIPISVSTYLHAELHIFSTPYGRSLILTAVGLLMLQLPWGMDTLVGLSVCGGGVYIYMNMRHAEIALAAMKNHISDDGQLRVLFDKCDLDKNGSLDSKEVAMVCRELGTILERNELEAALALLDADGNGVVSYEEFRDWYQAHR
jgi:hypothetical protein